MAKVIYVDIDDESHRIIKGFCKENALKISAWAGKILVNAALEKNTGFDLPKKK